ncbi:MAG: hypothetical protein GY820_31280 [Gammaproteobacteria bacterium]|nr:hypothetical protein [Gammaproteobacteria bacterium]
MNEILLQAVGSQRFQPFPSSQQQPFSCTILLQDGNHWVAQLGNDTQFDSREFQSSETCGVYAALTILAFAQGGLEAARRFFSSLSLTKTTDNDLLTIEALQEWIRGRDH